MLQNKKILVGITGSIAAYKAATLVRLFVKQGAEVKVLMTPTAHEFIAPVTLSALSKHTVSTDFFDSQSGQWDSHVDIGLWADAFIIAPCTANTIAKMAHGIADNLLLTTYLSARCKVFVAPAMDLDMYKHPATQANIETLKTFGAIFIEPTEGELASGLIGKGRMAEPEEIAEHITRNITASSELKKKVLVTAGPTYEAIDPVRFIGNHSTGKMGYAIAEELAAQGAEVLLISGPTNLHPTHPNISKIPVTTAQEMYDATITHFPGVDAAILSAAVADFTPKIIAQEKIKDKSKNLVIELAPTKDIAKHVGMIKKPQQVVAGFALETHNELQHAIDKLQRKNFDFIVLNSLAEKGAGFGHDTNKISIITNTHEKIDYNLKHKTEVAKDIISTLALYLSKKE